MKPLGRQAVCGKFTLQRLAKAWRAAKPDAGIGPVRHGSADMFSIQSAILAADQNVQADACGGMTQPEDIAVAEELCSKRGGFAHVARYERGANLLINCKDGTHIDVRPPKR